MAEPIRLSIPLLRLDGPAADARDATDTDTVDVYAAAMRAGDDFPAVVAFFDGKDYWLADGLKRILAALKLHLKHFPCDVRDGSRLDATLYAGSANLHPANGSRRTHEDMVAVVKMFLAQPEWADKSNRWIADVAKMSHSFVNEVRSQLEAASSSTPKKARKGKDGKTRKLPKKKKPAGGAQGEPGEDWDEDDEKDKPKNGAEVYKFRDFEAIFGKAVREIDRAGNAYGTKDTPEAAGLRRLLGEYYDQFKAFVKTSAKRKKAG